MKLPTEIKVCEREGNAQAGKTWNQRETYRPVDKALQVLGPFSLYIDFILCLIRNMIRLIPTQTPRNGFMHRNKRMGSPQKREEIGTKRTTKNDRLNSQVSLL